MNKKLLTAVVGAALVAGSAIASAAGPTVYGNLHMSVDRIDNDSAVSLEEGYLSSNFSYLGVKGDEDLGGGLKALYQVQTGFFADDGAGSTTGTLGFGGQLQDTFLGVTGGFGTLRFGRMDTPSKLLLGSVEQFRVRGGDLRVLTGSPTLMFTHFDNRQSNMVMYSSPSLAGVVLSGAYSTGEVAGPTGGTAALTTITSFGVVWTSGPFLVGLARETHGVAITAGNPSPERETSTRLGGKAGFGAFEVTAFYDKQEDLLGIAGRDRDIMAVGGKFKFGNSAVKAQYGKADKVDNQAVENGGTLMAVGFEHYLSKTFTVYADYSKAENDDGTLIFQPGGAPSAHGATQVPTTVGASPTMISVGGVLKF